MKDLSSATQYFLMLPGEEQFLEITIRQLPGISLLCNIAVNFCSLSQVQQNYLAVSEFQITSGLAASYHALCSASERVAGPDRLTAR